MKNGTINTLGDWDSNGKEHYQLPTSRIVYEILVYDRYILNRVILDICNLYTRVDMSFIVKIQILFVAMKYFDLEIGRKK